MAIIGQGFNFGEHSYRASDYETWTSYLDNTRWEADPDAIGNFEATWTGSGWLADEYAAGGWYWCYLEEIADDWIKDYRPTKLRITWTGGSVGSIELKDILGAQIALAEAPLTSPTELDITWDGQDLEQLEIHTAAGGGAVFTVTGIEFLEA